MESVWWYYITMDPFHVGIVGSRRRNNLPDRKMVFNLVDALVQEHGDRLVLVSGAARQGADSFAKEASRIFKVPIIEYPVDTAEVKNRWQFTQQAYARNRKIAERSEELFCLVHSDRTGGTENTVKHALELKRRIFLVNGRGEVYLSEDGSFPTCDPVRRLLA